MSRWRPLLLLAVWLPVLAAAVFGAQMLEDHLRQRAAVRVVGPAGPVAAPREAPATLALLIGVNEYADAGEHTPPLLVGAENDVSRAAALLTGRFGFDAAGIVKLVGKEATHQAIVSTFGRHLIEQAGPETRVVVWFSGHGSRVPDASKKDTSQRDDEEPFDETLIAWDSRFVDAEGGYDVTDDELFSLMGALRSRDVVLVTDACHSGGALRGGPGPGVRECRPGSSPLVRSRLDDFWPPGVKLLDDDAQREMPPNVVHIAACAADQEAGELQTELGTFGTLTWFLSQVLAEIDKDASWDRAAAEVRARVAGRGTRSAQTVIVAGDSGRALFGGRGRSVPAGGYQADRFAPGDDRLLVGAGRLHGIGEDAEFSLVDLDGRVVGVAVAYMVATTSCNARWRGAGAPPDGALRAVPKTIGQHGAPMRLLLEDGVDAKSVQVGGLVAVVGERSAADCSLRRRGEELELCNERGQVVRRMRAADVEQELRKEQLFRSLWEGVAAPGRYQVEIRVEPATSAEVAEKAAQTGAPPALVRITGAQNGSCVSALVGANELDAKGSGGLIRMTVCNRNERDLHIVIVAVSENREVNVIFGRDPNNVIRAGDSCTRVVWLGPGKGWPADRPMLDRYVVIATPRYADFKPFQSGASSALTRGDGVDALPPFLQQALGGVRRSGDMDEPAWGIGLCDLQLVTPQVFEAAKGR